MLAQVIQKLPPAPILPEPKINLADAEKLLAQGKILAEQMATSIAHINTSLLVTGIWIGAVTVICLWFVFEKFRRCE